MRIGSMYSGIGGLDIACEWAFGGKTVWQIDQVGEAVRARHWPTATQHVGDVMGLDPRRLAPIDVLCAGPSCKDISVAGSGRLFDGDTSGPTYRRMLDFIDATQPGWVVVENVPGLLSRLRATVDKDLAARGYGLVWVRCRALDVGAPHIRARVFVICQRGAKGSRVVDADRSGVWRGEAQRTWPTALASDAKASGNRSLPSNRCHSGTSLTDAIRPERAPAERLWGTPTSTDVKGGYGITAPNRGLMRSQGQTGVKTGSRLNPCWIEVFQGFPQEWTLPSGRRLVAEREPLWPRGLYPVDWDRRIPWPGFDWEPPRTIPDGAPIKGRPARLRALGNAVCPQQGYLGVATGLAVWNA